MQDYLETARKLMKLRAISIVTRSIVFAAIIASLFGALTAGSAFAAGESGGGTPNVVGCFASWVYDNVTSHGKQLAPVSPLFGDYNGTPSNETDTFTSTSTGTIALTTNAGGSVDLNTIITGVKVSLGYSIQATLSIQYSNSTIVTVPPYKTGNAQYGVWEQVTVGHYYYRDQYCHTTVDDGYVTVNGPWKIGWNTWIS